MTTTHTPALRRGCGGKKRHRTRGAAEAHRDRLIAAGGDAWALDVFWCQRHRCYHVGHVGTPGRSA